MQSQTSGHIVLTGVVVIIVLLVASWLHLRIPIYVTTLTRSGDFSVVGEGKVTVVPDTAYIDAGIRVVAGDSVDAVQQKINTVNNAVLDALHRLGIPKTNITTSAYSVSPNTTWDPSGQKTSGYNGNVTISIKLNNTSQVSTVIDAVSKAGANEIQGTRFTVDNPDKFRQEARQKAIDAAKTQAKEIAQAAGIHLGNIVNVVEQNASPIYPMQAQTTLMGTAKVDSAPVPQTEPGSQTVTSMVTVYFDLR